MTFFCSDPDATGCQMVTLSETRYEAWGRGWRFGDSDAAPSFNFWRSSGAPVCPDCRMRDVRAQVAERRSAREMVPHGG